LTRTPILSCEVLIGNGPHVLHYGWLVHTVRGLDIDALEERLRRSFVETNDQVIGPMQLCGWVRV